MEQVIDAVVALVAQRRKITKALAAKYIEKCLENVSAAENVPFSKVHSAFYTFSGLTECLRGTCENLDLEECSKMCHCVIYKGKCRPRYIAGAATINRDPDKHIMKLSTADLQELVEYASFLYYNYDGGGLTDNTFDALEYNLNKRLKLKGRQYEKIGAEPVDRIRTKLPYPMGSLEKIKPDSAGILDFLKFGSSTGLVWSQKLDGVSALIVFKKGAVSGIYTRGDGNIGGDVTFLKDYLTLPSPAMDYLVVRGELVVSNETWNQKYKTGKYNNQRSFVSAKVNSGYISPDLFDIQFLAYQVFDTDQKKPVPPSQGFKILSAEGFKTPVNGIFEKGKPVLIFDVVQLYTQQRQQAGYLIDGLVLATDMVNGPMKAFKMTLESQIRTSVVTDIDWAVSRYGRYVPVAVFESVYIDGVRLHRANAFNGRHVIDWSLGRGTKIEIVRSGDVIPVIKNVTVNPAIQPILPPSTYPWHWSNNQTDILLDDIEGNPEVQVKRIVHFFETIAAPGIGEGRVQKLYDAGYKTLKQITNLSQADLLKIKGFGAKLSETVHTSIHETMKTTRMDRYYTAITTFKTQVGKSLLQKVLRKFPGLFSATSDEIVTFLKANKIPDIGPKRIESLAMSIPKFKAMLLELNPADIKFAIKRDAERIKNIVPNSKIKGGTFVFTGFLGNVDADIEDAIWDNWGDVVSVVTRTTTGVITGNVTVITDKMALANQYGVPVYTVSEFKSTFGL